MCLDDAPGKQELASFDNSFYLEIVNSIYAAYWKRLEMYGIQPKKYSWHFDRVAVCDGLFSAKTEKLIPHDGTYEIPLCDGFLPRFCGRGFSDQMDVPKELHNQVIDCLLDEFREKYGDDFAAMPFRGAYDDIKIMIYRK